MRVTGKEICAALPDGSAGMQFVYLVAASNGTIKAGCTRSPKDRISSHLRALRAKGIEIDGVYVVATAPHKFHVERELLGELAKCSPRLSREWFRSEPIAAREILDRVTHAFEHGQANASTP